MKDIVFRSMAKAVAKMLWGGTAGSGPLASPSCVSWILVAWDLHVVKLPFCWTSEL